jgi:hypothetical protein
MTVRFPVYKYEVRVIFSRDLVATGRRLQEPDDLSQAGAGSITQDQHPRTGWLVFGRRPTPGDIAHEAGHAIYALAKCVGTTLDEETFCYHQAALVERIHQFLH